MNLDAIAVPEAQAAAPIAPAKAVAPDPMPPRINQQTAARQELASLLKPPDFGGVGGMGGEDTDSSLMRRRLILKIKAYSNAFPKLCGDMVKTKELEDMSLKQLAILLNEVKFTVGARTSGIVTAQGANGLVAFAQDMLKDQLELSGPVVELKQITQAQDFQDLTKELVLEYADWIHSSPLNRFLMYMGQSMAVIHKTNAAAKSAPGVEKRKREEEVADKEIKIEDEEPDAKKARTEEPPEILPPAGTVVGVSPVIPRDESGFEILVPSYLVKPPASQAGRGRGAPAQRGRTTPPTPTRMSRDAAVAAAVGRK